MRKVYQLVCIIVLLGGSLFTSAQTSLSFYHLGDATYQNSSLNPAYIPNGRVFIGLPVLSGVHFHINNKFSYNDVITKEGNNNVVKISSLINNLQRQNMFSGQVNISLFHLGYRFSNGTVMSIFANERIEVDFLYPKTFMEFLWEGNTSNLGETLEIGSMGVNVIHFREIGFHIAHQLNPQLNVVARLKMLQGFLS